MSLFAKHQARFELAQEACRQRHCWSPYPDMPDKYPEATLAKKWGKPHLNSTWPRVNFN